MAAIPQALETSAYTRFVLERGLAAEFAALCMRLLKIAGHIAETARRVRIALAATRPEVDVLCVAARSLHFAGP